MSKQDNEYLANRLRELRARHNWTQEELGLRVGVTRQTIIAIEKGEYNPSVMLALKIAQAFGLPLEEVFWLTTEKPAEKREPEAEKARRKLSLSLEGTQSAPQSAS